MKLNIARQGTILAFIPLLFQLTFVILLINELHKVEKILNNQGTLRQIAKQHNALHYDYGEYLIHHALYVQYGDKNVDQKRIDTLSKVKLEIARLKDLTASEPNLSKRFKRFERRFEREEKFFTEAVLRKSNASPNSERLSSYPFFPKVEKNQPGKIIQPVQFFSDSSRQIESRYQYVRALIQQGFNRVIVTGVCLSILISILLAFLFSRRIISRMAILKDNAARMAQRLPLHPPVRGLDEIALLDSVFHSMAEDSQAADSQKKQLLNLLSNNLKQPLNRAVEYLTMASENEPATSQIQKKLHSLRGNLLRLCSLIQDLLDVESLESGSMELSISSCKISTVIEAASSAVQGYLINKKLQLIVTSESDPIIPVDALKIEQVLINFLSNAIKFSPAEETIEINVENTGPNSVKIKVVDHGPGIPDSKNLFNRFTQTNPDADTAIGGSGLGLSICKTIVEAHNGQIGVENIPGKGSCFWFHLHTGNQRKEVGPDA